MAMINPPPGGNKIRRTHTKSRSGCRNCKLRRIKCDEYRPRCYNCTDRNDTCEFQRQTPSVCSAKVPIPRVSSNGLEPDVSRSRAQRTWQAFPEKVLEVPLYEGQNMSSRTLELQLFCYYINVANSVKLNASDTLAFDLNPQLLAKTIPQLALSSDYLMHALLSVSACNIRASQPSNLGLKTASHKYMMRAISRYRTILTFDTNEENFDTLYLTSMVIGCHTLGQRLFQSEEDLLSSLHQWLQAFQGIKLLARTSPYLYKTSHLRSSLPSDGWQSLTADDIDLSNFPSDNFAFLINDMDHTIPDAEQLAYKDVIAYLSLLYLSPSRSLICRFLMRSQDTFISCLSRGDSKARLLFGVYLCIAETFNSDRPFGIVANIDLGILLEKLPTQEQRLLRKAMSMIQEKFGGREADLLVEDPFQLAEYELRPGKQLALRLSETDG